jgi:hypothetical protein
VRARFETPAFAGMTSWAGLTRTSGPNWSPTTCGSPFRRAPGNDAAVPMLHERVIQGEASGVGGVERDPRERALITAKSTAGS